MGAGETGKLLDVIAEQLNGSDIQANLYPATADDPNYFFSVVNGTFQLKEMVMAYAELCPEGKMALFGYSQVCLISFASDDCDVGCFRHSEANRNISCRAPRSPATFSAACQPSGLCTAASTQQISMPFEPPRVPYLRTSLGTVCILPIKSSDFKCSDMHRSSRLSSPLR